MSARQVPLPRGRAARPQGDRDRGPGGGETGPAPAPLLPLLVALVRPRLPVRVLAVCPHVRRAPALVPLHYTYPGYFPGPYPGYYSQWRHLL